MDKSNQFNKKINKKNLYKLKFQFYFIFYVFQLGIFNFCIKLYRISEKNN